MSGEGSTAWRTIEMKVNDGLDRLFDGLDDVGRELGWDWRRLVARLRAEGYTDLADMYEEWCIDGEEENGS